MLLFSVAMEYLPGTRTVALLNRSSVVVIICLDVFEVCPAFPRQSQQPVTSESWKLRSIEFEGLQRVSRERAVAATGLVLGQTVTVSVFNAATDRLAKSGFFKRVKHRYQYSGDAAELTFEVEDAKWLPVLFDNFPWFGDSEIQQAVRAEEPSFDGTAPSSGDAIDSIKRALQKLISSRNIPGQIEYLPSYFPNGADREHVFRVSGSKTPMCTLLFPNASGVKESELVKLCKPLFADDYSRSFVRDFAESNLVPVYRERGYLRVRFTEPAAKPESDNCKNGVSVTVGVEEGLAYKWDRADWSGNATLSNSDLDSMLGIKQADVANGLKIDRGLKAVRQAYGKRGFITARLSPTAAFDDAKQVVAYRITVSEGAQYRMGNVSFTGLSDGEAASIKQKWKLEAGQVYDATYPAEFSEKALSNMTGKWKNIEFVMRPDKERLTVDVIFSFKR